MAAPAIPQQQAAQRVRNQAATGWQRPWWLDAMLSMYLLIMLAALAITAHGTKTFYGFILPALLAYAATIVLSLGIPVLEYAAITAPKGEKKPFVIGVVFLVGLETLAQYYQAQASFTAQIRAQFSDPAGIDLATFAMQSRGRLLPLLFLSALPLVVLGAGYTATHRWLELCAARPQEGTTDAQRIADAVAPYAATIDKLKAEVAGLMQQVATANDQAATAATERQQAIDAAQRIKQQLDKAAQRPAITDSDIVNALASGQWSLATIAQRMTTAGMSSAEIAQRLGTSRQAVDNWLKKGGE